MMTTAEPARMEELERSSKQPHIMVATDGSRNAARAADYAADLASRLGAHVTVAAVAVEREEQMFPWQTEPTEHAVPSQVAGSWTHAHADRVRSRGGTVTEIILEGHAGEALITAASMRSVDVVIVGRHGTTDGEATRQGSVADELVRRCPCVLVVVP